MGNFIYKYVLKDEIIYIGKTKNLDNRIYQHSMEEKFKPHLKESVIFYFECANSVEMDLIERALINQYKPKLNVYDKHDGFSGNIIVKEPKWTIYKEPPKNKAYDRIKAHDKRKESFERAIHNRRTVEVYKYIRRELAHKRYCSCEDFEISCLFDKENSVAITMPPQFSARYPLTFWFERGGYNLPIGVFIDNELRVCMYIVDKDFLKSPCTKEFEKMAKDFL